MKEQTRCVVACHAYCGEPDFFFVIVEAEDTQYDNGDHYDTAIEYAKDQRYEGPYVVFDENDGPAWLFERFVWESASVIPCLIIQH